MSGKLSKFCVAISLLVLLCLGGCGGGTEGTNIGDNQIRGLLIDQTGQGVPNTQVFELRSGASDITSAEGEFLLEGVNLLRAQTLVIPFEGTDLSVELFPHLGPDLVALELTLELDTLQRRLNIVFSRPVREGEEDSPPLPESVRPPDSDRPGSDRPEGSRPPSGDDFPRPEPEERPGRDRGEKT